MAIHVTEPRPDPPALINRTVHYHLLSAQEQKEVDEYRTDQRTYTTCSRRAQVFVDQHCSGA